MIKSIVAEKSALMRSIVKEMISNTKHFSVISDAASFDELEKKISDCKPRNLLYSSATA